jgi:uncharacterized protein DUF4189
MSHLMPTCARLAVAACLLINSIAMGWAAGAMAVGACAAYGYAYDFTQLTDARTAALAKCVGSKCKVVGVMQHACGAFAIDGHKPCGAAGYAFAPQLAQAENLALKYCYQYGGHDCVIRAFACDAKG